MRLIPIKIRSILRGLRLAGTAGNFRSFTSSSGSRNFNRIFIRKWTETIPAVPVNKTYSWSDCSELTGKVYGNSDQEYYFAKFWVVKGISEKKIWEKFAWWKSNLDNLLPSRMQIIYLYFFYLLFIESGGSSHHNISK